MYSVILHYRGYTIIVENYMYSIALNPMNKFISMDDAKKEVDKICEYFEEAPTEERIEIIKQKLKQLGKFS